jgi:uncharacterized phosphosugar-binding protein
VTPTTQPALATTPREQFTAEVAELLARIARVNAAGIDRAAEALLATIRADGLVHVGGAGHGLMLALESFYRAGGLACVDPIWRPGLLPLAGARASTQGERSIGLGGQLADEAAVQAIDCVVVASQSGLNPVAIELAARGRERGATVIAITSVAHARSAPSRDPAGRRLPDVADVVIDTGVPVGDAAWQPRAAAEPGARRVGALSSIASCHAWNLVLVTLAAMARTRDVELPIWVSSNVPGGDEANAALLARYGDRVAAL